MSDHLSTLSFIDAHLLWLRQVRRLHVGTVECYHKILVGFAEHINGEPLHLVEPAEIEAFLRRPRGKKAHGQPGSAATVSKDRAIISGFYKWLMNMGELAANPVGLTGAPRVRSRQPKPIPDSMFLQVWASALPLERVWLGLGGYIGLRRAEIVQLRADQINVTSRTIVSFTRKGGGDDTLDYGEVIDWLAERMPHLLGDPNTFLVPFHNLAERRLGRSLLPWDYRPITPRQAEKHGLPLGSIDPQILNRMLHIPLRRAGLPPNAFTPHALRHTAATNLLRSGLPLHIVQNILNHQDISTTLRYVKVSGGAIAEWRRQNGDQK